MNNKGTFKLNRAAVTLLLLLFCGTMTTVSGLDPVWLGTAGDFVILTKLGVVTTGATEVIGGDLGTSPSPSLGITGFNLVMNPLTGSFSTSSLVDGKVYASDYNLTTPAKMTTAISDMEAAYNDAAGRTPANFTDYKDIHYMPLTFANLQPGIYKWNTYVSLSESVIFDGSSTDIWILQIAGNLYMPSKAHVILKGGALPENIFWQVSGVTTIAAGAKVQGIFLCSNRVSFSSDTSFIGRLFSQQFVTLYGTTIQAPPTPTCAKFCDFFLSKKSCKKHSSFNCKWKKNKCKKVFCKNLTKWDCKKASVSCVWNINKDECNVL